MQARGSNIGATRDVGERDAYGVATVWWVWTATETGALALSTDGSGNFVKVCSIQTGDQLNDPLIYRAAATRSVSVTVPVTKGTTYRFAIGGDPNYSENAGPIVLNLLFSANNVFGRAMIPEPANHRNDEFTDRTLLSQHRTVPGGLEVSAIGYNWEARQGPFEPAISGVRTCWWEWRCPMTGMATFNTVGSDPFVKRLVVFQQSAFGDLVPFDAAGANRLPELNFPVTEGNVYHVSVGGDPNYSENFGFILLNILVQQSPIPSDLFINTPATNGNDLFANRVQLRGGRNVAGKGYISAIGSNVSAGTESFEPPSTGTRTVWWNWTAPATGPARITTVGSDPFVKVLSVFTGSGFANLVSTARAGATRNPEVSFQAIGGTEYAISVGGDPSYSENQGDIILNIEGPEVQIAPIHQPFRIRTAIELEIETKPGERYQLQTSNDLKTWQDLDAVIEGNGSIFRSLKNTRDPSPTFFRLGIQSTSGSTEFVYPQR